MKNNFMSTKQIMLCGLFTALTAVGAFIRIPIPFMPIPITLQLFVVLLCGLLLGAKCGLITQLLYSIIGLCGVPIFTKGGGFWYVFEPSFGYIIGFAITALVIGLIVGKDKKVSFKKILFACVVGTLIDYIIGTTYMYFILNLYMKIPITVGKAIFTGSLVFMPKDLSVCFVTALIANKLIPILKRQNLIS